MTITWMKKTRGLPGIYEELGVTPVINAIADVTILGGSTIGPTVKAAMEEANEFYVSMAELIQRSGVEISRTVGCDSAMVTSSCFAALVLSTAAVMTRDDPEKIARLPDSSGMKNEFLIMKGMRFHYDKCVEVAGGKLIEVGEYERTAPEQLESAIGHNTVGILYLANLSKLRHPDGVLDISEVVDIAKKYGIAVIIDAAGEVYPLERMRELCNSGADAVCFSLKYVGSPQSTGLITGSKEIIRNAYLNSFIAYETEDNHNLGRGYKLDRQEIIAAVVSIREWFTMDHEARFALQNESYSTIEQGLSGIPGLTINRFQDRYWYELWITVDEKVLGKNTTQIVQELKDGNPPIIVRQREPYHSPSFQIAVHQLRPGEPQVIVNRIREILVSNANFLKLK